MQKPDTLREAYVRASSFLEMRGVAEARSCTELLLQHLMGWSRSQLLLHWSEPFPEELEDDWQRLVERKAQGEPVQYIRGEQSFYGLPFRVTTAVLIPRPETELLVEAVLQRMRERWPQLLHSGSGAEAEGQERVPLVADIGTGSGAIAVALASHRPDARVVASDLSAEALEVARGNAVSNGVGERIEWLHGDLLEPFLQEGLRIDVLISNPPYIREDEHSELQPEVRFYEPKLALVGGLDGMNCYRSLIAGLKHLSAMPYIVAFEVGQGQARQVATLLSESYSWNKVEIIKDYAGIERHVIATQA